MAQITRTNDPDIENGNVIDADDLDSELDSLVSESNSQDTRITTLESGNTTISGNKTFSGTSTFSGSASLQSVSQIRFPDSGELTIASGAITITGMYHTVDTESDAATDDLDTINGTADGKTIILQSEADARDVVVKHNTGNIFLAEGADFVLETKEQSLTLIYSSALSKWVEVGRSRQGPIALGSWGIRTNYYYGHAGMGSTGPSTSNGITLSANRLYAIPFVCPVRTTFTRIGSYVKTLGASSTVRLGIYTASGSVPGSLVLDAGTVATTSTGEKEITISQSLAYGKYFLVMANQAGTPPEMVALNNIFTGIAGGSAATGSPGAIVGGYYVDSITGALPASFGTPSDLDMAVTSNPHIWLRKV